jgi:glycosyltransferase involved in cell wall biosynthesis
MKVLFYYLTPFSLAHGGLQSQIVHTREALQSLGVEVEYLRWYDDSQRGDILHYFGRIPMNLLGLAHQKKMRVVMAELLTAQGSRPPTKLWIQRTANRLIEKAAPFMSSGIFGWPAYRQADACIALTAWEAELMHRLFGAPQEKLHVIPNGVEKVFLESRPTTRGPWLVCTATITERKRVLELAEAAIQAQTPVWIIGKPYADGDPYGKRFVALAKKNSRFIRYEGPIGDRARMAQVYREARGFVLLSTMESLSLSALEAAACECPLLLSDLPWARTVFKETVSYCPVTDTARTAAELRRFYDAAPKSKPPAKPMTWLEVAQQLRALYETLLKTSR